MEKIINHILKYRTLYIAIVAGVLLRIILIPISTHMDLLSATWREALYVKTGEVKVLYFIEFLSAFYIKAIWSYIQGIYDAIGLSSHYENSVSYLEFLSFSKDVYAPRYLFFLKFPYLLIDLLTIPILIKFFKKNSDRILAVLLWAFNPLILYSVFIWGRYDVVAILFLFLSLYYYKEKKDILATIFFGLTISIRLNFLLLLPIFVIYRSKSVKDYIVKLIISAVPLLVLNKLIMFLGGSNFANTSKDIDFGQYLLWGKIGSDFSAISLFLIAYALILFFVIKLKNRMQFYDLLYYSMLIFIAYFSFSYFNPHYLVWISPFFLLLATIKRKLIWIILLSILLYFVFIESHFGSIATWGLFSPINSDFFDSIDALYRQKYLVNFTRDQLTLITKTLFVLSLAGIAYFAYEKPKIKS